MKKIQLKSEFTVFENINELENIELNLMRKAIEARNNAYAPYSNFNVGVAILLNNDIIILGNNQENAAYPSGLCAERVAIYSAGANYPNTTILKIAITASSSIKHVDKPIAPCGSCRQSIAEYEIKQESPIEIIFMGETGKILKTESLKSLLPLSFDKSFL